MKTVLAFFLSLSASWGITNVTLPYLVDTASIPKVRYVDKNDSALKWGINNLGDTVNAATGTGILVRKISPALTSPALTNPVVTGILSVSDSILGAAVRFSGGFTSQSGSVVEYSNPGTTANLRIGNLSSAAGSEARLNLQVNGSAAGDPFIRWDVSGVTSWAGGIDNSVAGDPWVLAASGALGSSNAISVTTAGNVTVTGSVTADSLISTKVHEVGSFTGTLTGVSGSVTATIYYERIYKTVVMVIPAMTGTSNSTSCTITGLPASLSPTHTAGQYTPVYDNGAVVSGGWGIAAGGTTIILATGLCSCASFTGSGIKGLNGQLASLTYTLQ